MDKANESPTLEKEPLGTTYEGRLAPLEAVLRGLENALVRYKAATSWEIEKDFCRGLYAGYEDGMKRAIEIVNYEIGIRQNPPNINYPGERPGGMDFNKEDIRK